MQQAKRSDAALPEALAPLLGDRLMTSEAARRHYAASEGHHGEHVPDLVARPETVEEVQQIVRAAAEHGVPVVPYGAGTSLEGNAAAVAEATPCCPAPVSATMRFFPIRLTSSACPNALLILCAPVCARSSLFR